LQNRQRSLDIRAGEIAGESAEIRSAEEQMRYIRRQLLGAISIITDSEDDTSVGRALRGIRIRGDT
jgi:hypothetical protein